MLVLQRLEGLSDREAVDRFTYDARWRYACGVGGREDGWVSFDHSVLVRFRMRLEASDDPRRIFNVSTEVAAEAGLIGPRRMLDSAPLFDAVATMDTVTLIRSAIRGLLRAADPALGAELRAVLSGGDDYAGAGKPPCDWDDADARAEVVGRLARDGLALLELLEGRQLTATMGEAAQLAALVIGQDLEPDETGTYRIVRGVATDRVISTVDTDARHGHKTSARRFDGYKGHVAADPDSETITDTTVGPANAGDGAMTDQLTRDLDHTVTPTPRTTTPTTSPSSPLPPSTRTTAPSAQLPDLSTTARTSTVRTPPTAKLPSLSTTVRTVDGRRSMGIRPTAREPTWPTSSGAASWPTPRFSLPLRVVGCSPRMTSPSTWKPTRWPARAGTPSRSVATPTVTVSPASVPCA